jgi:hypothetical protein
LPVPLGKIYVFRMWTGHQSFLDSHAYNFRRGFDI